ncbi:MAG: acetyl-CoA carboxylase biotin carboxyl carrier protein [Candidatus Marinimicrobia bacterium]|nr:acetyl-CoA carboxylase biotin carboxyl carrier protein [Candidatus Neomarinimicrobiota bacterium]MBL7009952.1 acetyl-CoA carboxylase biotin carboxyl carrier protein [Candidatus Neomarinimicrobiota bacterium]MBL7029749.1 acetyl-CoA carboxylase biotin carboxyl carrier protein [Candidatus Neomarinimicrobiota bacterium]
MWQDKLKEIIYLLENSDVNEIDVTMWGRRFRVVKSPSIGAAPSAGAPAVTVSPPSQSSENPEPVQVETGSAEAPATGEEILSPMPGTFYTAPSPDADPFVKVGDSVSEGDPLCIIEAMKIMNEIEAETSGTITKILLEDGQAVEYNQPLFVIESS